MDKTPGGSSTLPAQWLEPIRPTQNSTDDYREVFTLLCDTAWQALAPDIGPLSEWCMNLRMLVQMMFTRDQPHSLRWGKELVNIYNPAYRRELAGQERPLKMGESLRDSVTSLAGSDYDEAVSVMQAIETASPVDIPEHRFFSYSGRCDPYEEAYVSHRMTPIYDDRSAVVGVLCDHPISTKQVLHARRGKTLRKFVDATQNLSTMLSLRIKLQHSFDSCALDFPLCQVFLKSSFLDDPANFSPDTKSEGSCEYRAFARAGMSDQATLRTVDFYADQDPSVDSPMFAKLARQAHKEHAPVFFNDKRIAKYCQKRAFDLPCSQARFSPIYANAHDANTDCEPFGFVLLGFSPCRPVDAYITEYANTVDDLIITAFQNIQGIVQSKARLSEGRATREVGERYFRIIDSSPVGISLQNWKTQETMFANARWKTILGFPTEDGAAAAAVDLDDWASLVDEEDLKDVYEVLSTIKPGTPIGDHHIRLKRKHTNGKPAWVTASCTFHFDKLPSTTTTADDDDIEGRGEDRLVTILATSVHDISEQVYAKESEIAAALETERLRAAQRSQAERADEADRARKRQLDYIDTLAHEIRNPISAVVQSVEVLLERLQGIRDVNAAQAHALAQSIDDLATIDICTTHMSRVINDALNVSKLEHGSLAINLQDCDLLAEVESVLRMLRQDLGKKGIACGPVEVDATWRQQQQRQRHDSVHLVRTDALRYKQVLLNLLTNAIKFTAMSDRKEIAVRLCILPPSSHDEGQRTISCSVTDSGKGMSPEAVEGLFGKFYQGSARTHVDYGGSGLGLYISRRLATLLNGSIQVTSELGHGSTFTFSISAEVTSVSPSSPPPPPPPFEMTRGETMKPNGDASETTHGFADLRDNLHIVTSSSSSSTTTTSSRRPSDSVDQSTISTPISPATATATPNKPDDDDDDKDDDARGTILVVEDNLINQKLLVKQLRHAGYRVLVGNHGGEALVHFTAPGAPRIDLVLTDIEMPVMSGLQLLAHVRQLGTSLPYPRPPFFACSAYAREEQRQGFLEAGMAEVIPKPFKFAYLKSRIQEVIHPN